MSDESESETFRAEEAHIHSTIRESLESIVDGTIGRHDMAGVEEAERLARAAQPGEWTVVGGRVVRYDGTPVVAPESLTFMARMRALAPSLVRIVFALRRTLVSQIAAQMSARAESKRDRETLARHRDEIANAAGATGPADEFELIMYFYRTQIFYEVARSMNRADRVLPWAPEFTNRPAVDFLKRWMAGHSVQAEIAEAVDEGAKFQRQWLFDAEQNRAKHVEAVTEFRRLLEELRAGRIPSELEPTKPSKRAKRS